MNPISLAPIKILAQIISYEPGTEKKFPDEISIKNNLDNMYALAIYHRCIPRTYKFFFENSNILQDSILEKLKVQQLLNQQRMLLLASETFQVIEELNNAGIQSVSLKGPILSWQLYNDFALRSSRDIDILVQWTDVYKACEIL